MTEWISVEDRLPEPDGSVIVGYPKSMSYPLGGVVETTRAEYVINNPSQYPFWMPLPEPPDAVRRYEEMTNDTR